jgi:hypothetical protein
LNKVETRLERLDELKKGEKEAYEGERTDLERDLNELNEEKKYWMNEISKWSETFRNITHTGE